MPSGGGTRWATVSGQRRSQLSADPLGGGRWGGVTEFSKRKPGFLTYPLIGIRFEGGAQRGLDSNREPLAVRLARPTAERVNRMPADLGDRVGELRENRL